MYVLFSSCINSQYEYNYVVVKDTEEPHQLLSCVSLFVAQVSCCSSEPIVFRIMFLNPFRTAVPFWGQTTQILSILPPKRDCGPKRSAHCGLLVPGMYSTVQHGPANKKHLIVASLRFLKGRHLQTTLSIGYYIGFRV